MKRKIAALILIVLVTAALSAGSAYAYIGGVQVKEPTQEDIVRFALNHPTGLVGLDTAGKVVDDYSVLYLISPILTAPYFPGILSDEENNNALNTIKTVRYIAGINHEVTLSEELSEKAQAACMVNYANGNLSHYPKYPQGMDGRLSTLGVEASRYCNLARYTKPNASLKFAILDGWMSDSDSSNISSLGHRRWILNPAMGAVGFGIVSSEADRVTYNAMYVRDDTGQDDNYIGVKWPAANMPISCFKAGDAWSISLNETLSSSNIKVSLIKIDNLSSENLRYWNFSKEGSDGDFYVSNSYYGQTGCIIFRPEGVEAYNAGDKYYVSISGLTSEISYTVEFFDMDNFYSPAKPKLSSVKLSEDNKPVIEWGEVENAESYDVFRCPRGGGANYVKLAEVTGERKYEDKTALSGVKYFYKVSAVREELGKRYASEKSGYLRGVTTPLGKAELTKIRPNQNSIFIDWDKVDGRTGYLVYRKAAGAAKYKLIASTDLSYYYDKSAVRGTRYSYRVRAYKTYNSYTVNGDYSEPLTAARF